MRIKIYNFLVNRVPGISYRYHKMHDGSSGINQFLSWLYLFFLNFAYYILFLRFLGKKPGAVMYEEKRLLCNKSESEDNTEKYKYLSPDYFVEKLLRYDIVSFDIFDTLIFRPFSDPTDLFYFVGERLDFMDFKSLRIRAEYDARRNRKEKRGDYEVNLDEIWSRLSEITGIDKQEGMKKELEAEKRLCYANPFMLDVWSRLKSQGKRLIIVSDMYLPEEFLSEILDKNGFSGAEKIYISNSHRKSKAEGSLFEAVRNEFQGSMVHVGDNPVSDVKRASEKDIDVLHYPNINRNALLYRAYDMSAIVGGAYRGIVDNAVYNGLKRYSMEYEYGFIYGGLFVLGYCGFIHKYCRNNRIERILFLSRDGDILKKAYDYLYPDEDTRYVHWSRKAALKLTAGYNRYDFLRRFIDHKIGDNITIGDAVASMDISSESSENTNMDRQNKRGKNTIPSILNEELHKAGYSIGNRLDIKSAKVLKGILTDNWEIIIEGYAKERDAAKIYYKNILCGCKKAAAVDIGWAGSGAVSLITLEKNEWKTGCEIVGIIAGTNTVHNAEPDASETFLQSGRLVSYMYSQRHNRDLLKKHDPNRDYNVFWELLLSSTEPGCTGFTMNSKGEGIPSLGNVDANPKGIQEIQRGILDFVREYSERFKDFEYMLDISGRDAYAPMLAAAGHNEEYLMAIKKRFDLHIGVE